MANKKINELSVRTPSLSDLMLVGDPTTGYSYKATISSLSTLLETNIALDDLNDVTITAPTNGQVLRYNGTAWVNAGLTEYLALTDLSDVTITTPLAGQALAYNGTAWVNSTILGGSGTTNYISKWTSSSVLGNSLVYDNGTSVGVNTATPSASYKLDVSGATRILDGTASIILDNAQTYKVDINGLFKIRDGATNYILISGGNLTFPNGGIFSSSINLSANTINTLSGVLAFSMGSAGGTERMRLTNSGRLLIGTTTESTYELDVVGDIRCTLDANINGLTVGKGGGQLATNTAIGFEALNSASASGNNVAIGYRALKVYTGDSNVAIGGNALTSNTTGNVNVAVGYGAGQLITTANKNTLIGYGTGNANISSHNNTYVGYAAGISATGNANTLIGSEAGYNMSTGAQNTFVGNASGRAITTGGTNTLLGYFSGYGLTTGSENVLIGNNTMASASTASSNTLVGAYSGNVLTGSSNTFVGWYSGVSATSSVYNVGIGSGALQNITTGGYNTAIGHRAGRFFGAATSSNTTGANGIFIGYQSRASADGNTNETVIGYDALGNGSNSVTLGNTSVTKTILQGNVLIGTTTDAGYKLDVNGTFRAQSINTALSAGTQYVNFASANALFNTNSSSYSFAFWNGSNSFTIASDKVATLRRFDFLGQSTDPVAGLYGTYFNTTDNQLKTYTSAGWKFIPFEDSNHNYITSGGGYFGNTTTDASAILSATSTTKGFLPPRMTNAQMTAITTPAAGLVVYDTTNNKLNVYDGTNWVAVH